MNREVFGDSLQHGDQSQCRLRTVFTAYPVESADMVPRYKQVSTSYGERAPSQASLTLFRFLAEDAMQLVAVWAVFNVVRIPGDIDDMLRIECADTHITSCGLLKREQHT